MENSKQFSLMLNKAIEQNPIDFKDFDKTKNLQDQLQEMINHDTIEIISFKPTLGKEYDLIAYTSKGSVKFSGKTMEQLWLAFVMSEKFSKTWDWNDWKDTA